MSSNLQRSKKIVKYLFFGVVTAGVEFCVFILLVSLMHIYIASTISFIAGLVTSFLFNKFVVFKNSRRVAKSEVGQFIMLGVVNSQLSALLTLGFSFLIPSALAKILTMAMIALWNYLLMNLVIFKKHKDAL